MHAAIRTPGPVFACPVLIVGPGYQGQVTDPIQRPSGHACPLCADAGTVSLDDFFVVAKGRDAGITLLDPADACWEDAEWQ